MSTFWSQLVLPALNAFALTGSLLGLVIGVGLLVATAGTLDFFQRMNRRVSLRQATRALEIPRNVEGAPGKRHPALGIAFLLGGAYTAFVLLTELDTARTVDALHVARGAAVAEVLVAAARWFLVAGGVAAVAFGALLVFRPAAWAALEARANRWHSTRQMMRPSEEMHYGLDRIVQQNPRTAGALLVVTSIIASAAFAILLFR